MFNLTAKKTNFQKKSARKKFKNEVVSSQVKRILASETQNLIVAVKN